MKFYFEQLFPIIGTIALSLGLVIYMLADWAKEKWHKRFQEQLKASVSRETLNYSDLQHIAERWNQDRKSVLHTLRVLLSQAVADEDKLLSDKAEFVRNLLMEHQSREPYAELPENISLQLAAISPSLTGMPNAVPQLAASLSDLYSKNQMELIKQKKLAILGVAIGLLGLLASVPTIYSLFKP